MAGATPEDCAASAVELRETIEHLTTVLQRLDGCEISASMGEMESLRLQMAMDRLSKLMSTLSNILKKTSDTANAITQNLK